MPYARSCVLDHPQTARVDSSVDLFWFFRSPYSYIDTLRWRLGKQGQRR